MHGHMSVKKIIIVTPLLKDIVSKNRSATLNRFQFLSQYFFFVINRWQFCFHL